MKDLLERVFAAGHHAGAGFRALPSWACADGPLKMLAIAVLPADQRCRSGNPTTGLGAEFVG